jgi:myo-inositol-1(or 4)-monophosphatase
MVGEELSPKVVTDGLVWIVDPLDGTTNFLHDFSSYAVSIAAALDGVLEAGVVLHVTRNECYTASRDRGAWLGGRRLKVSAIQDPGFALIGTGFPFKDASRLDEYQRQFGRVAAAVSGIRRPGAAALDLADVAAGRFDGFWEQQLSAWDIAAGSLLIREAGGVITDFTGRDIGIEHTGVVAGNPAIHDWLLETLSTEQYHHR